MKFKKYLPVLAVVLCPFVSFSQTTNLPRGDKQEILLDRLEIKAQRDPALNLSKIKPYSRETFVPAMKNYLNVDSSMDANLTNVDKYYLKSLLANNLEWLPENEREQYMSKKRVGNTFYQYPAGLFETHVKDFDLVINPVLNIGFMKETGNDQNLFYNTRGISIRGRIANKIGFYTTLTDNQERYPLYVQDWMNERNAVPGAGYYKNFKGAGGRDYFDARGYVTFGVTKYIDVAFGYDKNFIGNGQRSLFLSDFGNNNLFLRLNTRIWKFNYQNLFMELTHAHQKQSDGLLGKKYAAMHHLDINLTKWLNVGIFEGIVFGRTNRFEFGYLVPVIFYRSVEHNLGSPDNAVVGMDFKANVARTAQVYGQLLFDELKTSELTGGNGWWANKFGYQIGAKYIDAFKVKNLDLQLELNRVRPYTYSHKDSVANYSHYNQPLAHPLMANFNEWIGVARYRPAPKWMIEGRAMYYTQGLDSTGSVNFGSNLFLPNTTRTGDYGHDINSGWKTNTAMASLLLSYEVKENLFLEFMGMFRKQRYDAPPIKPTKNSTVFNLGVRWNIARRDFYF
ncbi:hypothetical protein [Niabella ginsengisoli]|uniref:Capsule assembly Wzi family protein n=1 Tax=Niabella ginsengisoli TaxID=522298 RepID=A0ABS9SLS5_9BACT|nr:hypothetical protein [Niabella ginsengisoli]MCH5599275.1 hypothetical protein [Niabella ginsengisoli]